jgi:uncharacterized protein
LATSPFINQITIFPFKSLDGVAIQHAEISNGGCLLHDRIYAIIDANGKFINGKSTPKVNLLRTEFDFKCNILSIKTNQETNWNYFDVDSEKEQLERYLTEYFEESVHLIQDATGRFLDVPDLSGVTVVSKNSLLEVTKWFDGISYDESKRRFRANLEIDGVEAFWEDQLFLKPGTGIEFTIGDVTLFGVSPRARCVVPTRHSENAAVTHKFPKTFSRNRSEQLPSWSHLNNYNHHYYLSVDCYIPAMEYGKSIFVGDEIKIVGQKLFY